MNGMQGGCREKREKFKARLQIRERERERETMASEKPHAVCVPYPSQGHVTPMLKVAKLLHSRGFHITFVNNEFNHKRLIRSRGPSAVEGLPDFQFKTVPDGLPPSDLDATQDVPALCNAVTHDFLAPFCDLIRELNSSESGGPPVTVIVGDGLMSFTLAAAQEFGITAVTFWTTSAIGYLAYLHYKTLIDAGIVPLKDIADLTNGYLEIPVDWIPGLVSMRLKDFPSFIRTTDPGDIMLEYLGREAQSSCKSTAIILNTLDFLEHSTLKTLAPLLPPIYTIGPLSLLSRHTPPGPLTTIRSSLWKEDTSCLDWLEGRKPKSVVYVNYGSLTVMTNEQLLEFAWGLANSKHDFLWIVRTDLVRGISDGLPEAFFVETKGRGLMTTWCPQEEVLAHTAVGVFLTHSGWNSTLESISTGVPMLCWPFSGEQQTNCRYSCIEWGNGMEIDNSVKRGEVEALIKEVMVGEKGKEMRRRTAEWKEGAVMATERGGSSYVNFEKVVEFLVM